MNKNELLRKVKAEYIENLLDAVGTVLHEMKGAEPDMKKRYSDETYCTILSLNSELLRTLHEKALENSGKKVEG